VVTDPTGCWSSIRPGPAAPDTVARDRSRFHRLPAISSSRRRESRDLPTAIGRASQRSQTGRQILEPSPSHYAAAAWTASPLLTRSPCRPLACTGVSPVWDGLPGGSRGKPGEAGGSRGSAFGERHSGRSRGKPGEAGGSRGSAFGERHSGRSRGQPSGGVGSDIRGRSPGQHSGRSRGQPSGGVASNNRGRSRGQQSRRTRRQHSGEEPGSFGGRHSRGVGDRLSGTAIRGPEGIPAGAVIRGSASRRGNVERPEGSANSPARCHNSEHIPH
jgi:hypothetical protein